MRLVFAGTPEVAVPSLDALVDSRHDVVAVVTRPDAPSGRGRSFQASRVGIRAAQLGLEVLKPRRPVDDQFVARLRELEPDCCPVVAYGALIPQQVIDIPRYGWVNLHFCAFLRWRGAAPVQHAVLAGDEVTGATTFALVAALDAGPVYQTIEEEIRPTDTAGALLARLAQTGARLLVETLDGIESGELVATPQPADGVTLAPKITVEDAEIDWSRPVEVVDRLIRGCAPAPGAWTLFRGQRFKIGSARPGEGTLPRGRLEATKRSVRVGTGTTVLELEQVQAQGKKLVPAADWARGSHLEPEEDLGG